MSKIKDNQNQLELSKSYLVDVDVSKNNDWLINIAEYNGNTLNLVNILEGEEVRTFYRDLVRPILDLKGESE